MSELLINSYFMSERDVFHKMLQLSLKLITKRGIGRNTVYSTCMVISKLFQL